MAFILPSILPAPRPPPRYSVTHTRTRGILRCRSQQVPSSERSRPDERTRVFFDERSGTKRREALLQMFFSAVSLSFIATDASAEMDLQESFRTYGDEKNKFRIMVPQDWLVGAGEANGIKSVTAFYPKETSNSNVSVVITGLGPDYTRLESFGSVDSFAETLVSGLDRSWKNPPGVAAKLINSRAANGLYYIEYTLQNPGEGCRHLVTAMGMASNTWYNRLYTVTGQFMEDESEKYQSQIEQSVSSFRLNR